MGRGTAAAGGGGGVATVRHGPSVSPSGCHLPMPTAQGGSKGDNWSFAALAAPRRKPGPSELQRRRRLYRALDPGFRRGTASIGRFLPFPPSGESREAVRHKTGASWWRSGPLFSQGSGSCRSLGRRGGEGVGRRGRTTSHPPKQRGRNRPLCLCCVRPIRRSGSRASSAALSRRGRGRGRRDRLRRGRFHCPS